MREKPQKPAVHDALRLAVTFRVNQGKLSVLAAVTGVSEESIERFVYTGEISEMDRTLLRIHQ